MITRRPAPKVVVGIRVKSGWGSAVVIGVERGRAWFVSRSLLLLSDPGVPRSSQPFHKGFGTLQTDRRVIARLTRVVYATALRSLRTLARECETAGVRLRAVALVVGSTIDPALVTNQHIRAHASEARLFRMALERAAARLGLLCRVTRERDLKAPRSVSAERGATRAVADVGSRAGRPWRADEKAATLAAWRAIVS